MPRQKTPDAGIRSIDRILLLARPDQRMSRGLGLGELGKRVDRSPLAHAAPDLLTGDRCLCNLRGKALRVFLRHVEVNSRAVIRSTIRPGHGQERLKWTTKIGCGH